MSMETRLFSGVTRLIIPLLGLISYGYAFYTDSYFRLIMPWYKLPICQTAPS